MKKVVTHSGTFHADELFAIATIEIALANPIELIRTRDKTVCTDADIVVDVGGEYDEVKDRFDHHQAKGAGKRPNGIPYASFGLVWKKYALTICGNQSIVDEIDKEIVQPIDAGDNGIDIYKVNKYHVRPYALPDIVHIFNSTWKETERSQDAAFADALKLAKYVLNRAIERAKDKYDAQKYVIAAYEAAEDKQIIVIEQHYPTREILSSYPEPLFVVRPSVDGNWSVETVKIEAHSFSNRKDFPKAWAGKTGVQLQCVTGVADAIFCHRNLFLAVVGSKQGAMELAKKALL
jgi:uncharacterized UPF0160 family protein